MKVRIAPEWDNIRTLWDPSRKYLEEAGLDRDTVDALAMVIQELLENAVKYGQFKSGDDVRLTVHVRRREVTVEVVHPVASDETQLRKLDHVIQWIRGFQNPFEAYVERLKAVAATTPQRGESGLGLVRIAYEGQSILDFYVNDHNELAVSAVHPLRSAP